jgi:hypothetical protein
MGRPSSIGENLPYSRTVMRGLDPRICRVKADGRVKPGHDVVGENEAGFRRWSF